jgi:hypothetical protein
MAASTYDVYFGQKQNEARNPRAGRCCWRSFCETCSNPEDFHALLFTFGKDHIFMQSKHMKLPW